jgi:hypothetical protein
VKVSGGKAMATPDSDTPVGRGHHMVEEAMKKSGLAWAILRPGLFMQNTLAQAALIKNDSKMALPFAPTCNSPSSTRAMPAPSARMSCAIWKNITARTLNIPAPLRITPTSPRISPKCSASRSIISASRSSRPSRR